MGCYTNDPKYCLYHRMIHHPTDKCYVLKDRIQALIDARVLTLKSEQKKVTANMVTLEFGKTPKVTVPNGTYPVPAPRLKVKHPSAITQDNKGLVPLTLRQGKSYTQTSSCWNMFWWRHFVKHFIWSSSTRQIKSSSWSRLPKESWYDVFCNCEIACQKPWCTHTYHRPIVDL